MLKNKTGVLIGLPKRFTISWARRGVGFGVFSFYQKGKKLYIANECMKKEFIKEVLNALVDNSILEDK